MMCEDHKGKKFKTVKQMCSYHGIGYGTYKSRMERGWTLKDALTVKETCPGRNLKPYCDHLGNQFASLPEMCNHYGISLQTFYSRRKRGYSLDVILLSKKINRTCKPPEWRKCKDHLGNEFLSKNSMCKAYHISSTTLRKRLLSGFTLEEALTTPLKQSYNMPSGSKKRQCSDYLGNRFKNESEMCRYYGIKYVTYKRRLKCGWPKERLFDPVDKDDNVVDHLGNTYSSVEVMCKHYNMNSATFRSRLKNKWPLKDALTIPVETKPVGKLYEDHLGNQYSSLHEMCENYGIKVPTYRYRRKIGMSLEKALQPDANYRETKCVDHLGNEYKSLAAMARQYGLDATCLSYRLLAGMSLKDALLTPIRKKQQRA